MRNPTNRVGNSLPKGGHRQNLDTKPGNREPHLNCRLTQVNLDLHSN